jgi:hypothetical protein
VLLDPSLVLRAALAASAPEVPSPPEAGVRLEWVAAAECPDASRGAEHLGRFLGGRTPLGPARVELAAGAGGYVATVTVDGATRTLQASDCETLGRAAALVVAVSLDPVAAAEVVLRERPQAEESPVEPELGVGPELDPVEPDLTVEPEPDTSLRRTGSARADMPARGEPRGPAPVLGHSLTVGGGLGLAIVPVLTGAVRLGYAFDRDALRVQVDATYATPRTITYLAEPDVGGRLQSVGLGVRACFAPAAGRVVIPLCGGIEGGAVLGSGVGVPDTRSPVGVWIGGLASATALVRVHPRVALMGGAELLVSLRRPAFHVGDRETLFRSQPVGIRGLLGLALRLR